MTGYSDLLLVAVIVLDLYIVATSRLTSCVSATALQGYALALFPLALWWEGAPASLAHVGLMGVGTLLIKAIIIPLLLLRTIRVAQVHREVEPFVTLHVSVLIGALLVGVSFWFATVLVLPHKPPAALLVPAAFATLLLGFLVLVSRRQAITQAIGYLLIENGIFIFGQTLTHHIPFAVELGILLDLMVGIFVMGIAIHHISQEFDHIDTERLVSLKD
jgi:hydrogenase-4 component E